MASPLKKVFQELDEQGIEYKATKKGWLVVSPTGTGLVTIHATPSDHRALRNIISDLKRVCGYVPKAGR